MNEVTITAWVTEDFRRKLRTEAASQDLNMSEYLRDCLAQSLGFSSYAEYLHFGDENVHQMAA
ncbi:MAG: hypothetical protein H6642_00100 [Caldilineaceae bacterium]|nr:hypothetical protein [Caldilineaceae bacterium]